MGVAEDLDWSALTEGKKISKTKIRMQGVINYRL